MQSQVQRLNQTNELRIILALEPTWTVSIDGKEFVPTPSSEIEIGESSILFRRRRRKILDIEWLRPNIARVRTPVESLTFYPGTNLPSRMETRRRRRAFQTRLARALGIPARGTSGMYPKFIRGDSAVIAVDPEESQPTIDGIMRAAIHWPERMRRRVTVVVPAHRSHAMATRLHAMPAMQQQFDWLQWDGDAVQPLNMDLPNSETRVHEYREPRDNARVHAEVERLCALAPDLLQAVPHIPGNAISIRLRGLEIARVSNAGTTYPMGEPLQPLIDTLSAERRPGSRHPLARAYEERWLESNLIRQIRDLYPVLPDRIYPQVPSFAGEERRIIDLLAITEAGRLVVIEVKAVADPDLPFQAFDYWLAVERHRKSGDFEAKGYFTGMKISDEPAILIMVAPLLAFHRTLDTLVAELPRNLPLVQIGINQSWKREIKILRRKGALG